MTLRDLKTGTRKALIAAFCDLNADLIDAAGGLDQEQGHAAFDALNERAGRRGRGRVTALAGALKLACYRNGKRWVLDIATLNETGPAASVGGFRAVVAGDGEDWARDAQASAVGEIRDELQRMRDEVAYLRSSQLWREFLHALDRGTVRRAERSVA